MLCPICGKPGADKYLWCRPCIKRAARGAARWFLPTAQLGRALDDPDMRTDLIRRATNSWEKRFKRRLRRRETHG